MLRARGQFSLASLVYFTLSKLFPSRETLLEHAIIESETPLETAGGSDRMAGQVEMGKDKKMNDEVMKGV